MDEEEESQHMRSRSPYGERGLKSLMVAGVVVPEAVALLTESVD